MRSNMAYILPEVETSISRPRGLPRTTPKRIPADELQLRFGRDQDDLGLGEQEVEVEAQVVVLRAAEQRLRVPPDLAPPPRCDALKAGKSRQKCLAHGYSECLR